MHLVRLVPGRRAGHDRTEMPDRRCAGLAAYRLVQIVRRPAVLERVLDDVSELGVDGRLLVTLGVGQEVMDADCRGAAACAVPDQLAEREGGEFRTPFGAVVGGFICSG